MSTTSCWKGKFMGLALIAETTEDVRTVVDQAREGKRMESITVEKNGDVVIPAEQGRMRTAVEPALLKEYMAEEKKAGRDVKDLEQIARESAAKEIQTKKTTPAAQAKAGALVAGATLETLGATVANRDGDIEQQRGTATFTIKQGQDGKMTAVLNQDPRNQEQRLVSAEGTAKQEITGTLKVDGKSKQITLEVTKDGALTEKAQPPAQTPKVQTQQSTAPAR